MARLRARRDREPGPRVGEPRRRIHAQLPAGRSAADDLAGARVPSPLRARRSRSPRSTRSPSDWFPDQNRLVIVSAPEAAGVALPDRGAARRRGQDRDWRSELEAVRGRRPAGQPLMDAPPRAGTIVKTTPRPEAGITEWTLSNGATVVLKPTTLKEDQILFRATAPGGTSLASDADFIPARVADDVVPAGGVGRFSDVMLDRMLAGKAVAVRPFIGEIEPGHGRREHAAGSRDDVPAALPALHAAARRSDGVRRDGVAGAGAARESDGQPGRRVQPDDRLGAEPATARGGSPRRRRRWTSGTSAKSLAFYKARFADASNFTFVFVGSFTPETHQAARRDLHRQPAGDARARRPGATSASRRRPASSRQTDREGHRAEEPGGDRLLGPVRVRRRGTCWRCGR